MDLNRALIGRSYRLGPEDAFEAGTELIRKFADAVGDTCPLYRDPAAARAEYDQGWPTVIGHYAEHAAGPGEDDGAQTWAALLHRPGPSAPQDGSLFDDPRFAEHVAFLNRMREAGYLVAAGPLADEDGAGMTILRLPGAGQHGHAALLATRDDAAVAGGLLSVTVRPWQVMMSVLTPAS